MCTAKVEVLPGLSHLFNGRDQPVLLEIELDISETVLSLLAKLADEYPGFGNILFELNSHDPTGQVGIVLNNRLLELQGGLKRRLRDGDILVLLPALAGGSLLE